MLGLFKRDPIKVKRKEYDYLLETAMLAQRRGDMMSYAMLSADADKLWQEIDAIEQQQK